MRPGEEIELTDGRGGWARAVVLGRAMRDALPLDIRAAGHEPQPAPRIVLVQALAKGDRGELAVELATEVGVDEIVPWAAERCIARWAGERGERAWNRWQTTVVAAAKQSRRRHWPVLAPLADTATVAARLAAAALPVVLHEGAVQALPAVPPAGEVVIVVGPEGGITDRELATFAVPPYRLGGSVFRTSSAGPFAAAALLAGTARWR